MLSTSQCVALLKSRSMFNFFDARSFPYHLIMEAGSVHSYCIAQMPQILSYMV